MEIIRKNEFDLTEVWLTNEEQQAVDRDKLTKDICSQLPTKHRVVFFLSGKADLFDCTKQLLTHNLFN